VVPFDGDELRCAAGGVGEHWRKLGAMAPAELSSIWRALLEDGTPLPSDSWGVGGPLTATPL
jgi:hypothetical protein